MFSNLIQNLINFDYSLLTKLYFQEGVYQNEERLAFQIHGHDGETMDMSPSSHEYDEHLTKQLKELSRNAPYPGLLLRRTGSVKFPSNKCYKEHIIPPPKCCKRFWKPFRKYGSCSNGPLDTNVAVLVLSWIVLCMIGDTAAYYLLVDSVTCIAPMNEHGGDDVVCQRYGLYLVNLIFPLANFVLPAQPMA